MMMNVRAIQREPATDVSSRVDIGNGSVTPRLRVRIGVRELCPDTEVS